MCCCFFGDHRVDSLVGLDGVIEVDGLVGTSPAENRTCSRLPPRTSGRQCKEVKMMWEMHRILAKRVAPLLSGTRKPIRTNDACEMHVASGRRIGRHGASAHPVNTQQFGLRTLRGSWKLKKSSDTYRDCSRCGCIVCLCLFHVADACRWFSVWRRQDHSMRWVVRRVARLVLSALGCLAQRWNTSFPPSPGLPTPGHPSPRHPPFPGPPPRAPLGTLPGTPLPGPSLHPTPFPGTPATGVAASPPKTCDVSEPTGVAASCQRPVMPRRQQTVNVLPVGHLSLQEWCLKTASFLETKLWPFFFRGFSHAQCRRPVFLVQTITTRVTGTERCSSIPVEYVPQ